MSTIYFAICLLFFLSIISSWPAPRIIYSAVIENQQNSSIRCAVTWRKPTGGISQSNIFRIRKNRIIAVNERTFDMGTWTARAIIDGIRCGNLTLTAPFEKVDGPSIYWKFIVRSDGIVSVRPDPETSDDD